jgi:predicted dehydrogenase/threonine dehydrogenase-like Zn-dependent dehydrogenase
LVRNAFSLISAGTEGVAVTKNEGVRGLYEKIMNSRDTLGQVWDMVQSQGVASTKALIQNKLGDFNPIGYSCSGVVIEVDDEALGLKPGQRVSCMGTGFANHAEYVVIPKNLAVPIPESVCLKEASFGALACIAMQGIRRLELSPGERVAIVGLGLIGQIALRLAAIMGYQAFGFDIDEHRVNHAKKYSKAKLVLNSAVSDPLSAVMGATAGVGADGVVICASGKVDSIINQAFTLCRRRGRISVVGDIGLGLERAKMYAKELEVRLSCSYGVGRYDPLYELEGQDYPLPYVRWTERRNLEYFIELLADKRLSIGDLLTEKFEVESTKQAYGLIKSGDSNVYGVLLDYSLPAQPELPSQPFTCRYVTPLRQDDRQTVRLGLVGVGAYAKNIHVPNIRKIPSLMILGVASKSGASAAVVAKKVNADYATSDVSELLNDDKVDAVVISTRHSSHAQLVLDSLAAGKHVFVEKPMATTVDDCLKIVEAQQQAGRVVRVGYNRRFSPYLQQMKKAVGQGRKLLNVRVNVGAVSGHWSNTAKEGGRLMGEGVHFFDLANWIMGCAPTSVTASFLGKVDLLNPDASVCIRYEDGSIANVVYTTVGHTRRGKEYFELFGNGRTVAIDDYKKIEAFGCAVKTGRGDRGNKGQLGAMEEFAQVVLNGDGGQEGADAVAGLWATAVTEAALASAKQGCSIDMASFLKR